MRYRAGVLLAAAAMLLASCGGGESDVRGAARTPAPSPTPVDPNVVVFPPTWMHSLIAGRGGQSMLVSCLDADGDLRITAAETPYLAGADFEVPLREAHACNTPWRNRDHYQGLPSVEEAYNCDGPGPAPLLVEAVGGGGTDLLQPYEGDSQGLMPIVAGIQQRAAEAGISTLPILTSAAITGADLPQTRMEQFLALDLRRRLDALPCLRAVLIGHSHGGVTVTSVTPALDAEYGDRLMGVVLDRTDVLYDRLTDLRPDRTPILNVFQTNEGWHGEPIDAPNVTNADRSSDVASEEPRERYLPLATVTHRTLDDSPEVQAYVVEQVMAWAAQ